MIKINENSCLKDYLVRSKDPNGSFYISVSGRGPGKKPEVRRITAKAERHIILTPETKDKFRDYGMETIAGDAAYEAGWREGAGLAIAALAMAAARGGKDGGPGGEGYGVSRGEGDFGRADYLKAAEDCFAFLEKNGVAFTNDGQENLLDDHCALIAASELYRTTGKAVYREAPDRRATSLAGRLESWGTEGGPVYKSYWRADGEGGSRPFFHPVDAGLPVIDDEPVHEGHPGRVREPADRPGHHPAEQQEHHPGRPTGGTGLVEPPDRGRGWGSLLAPPPTSGGR